IREDLGLEREECAARVDEVEARKPVLLRDLLRTQVLLDGQREVRAPLHGGFVPAAPALPPFDDADPGDDPGRGRLPVVDIPRREGVQLEERGAGIEEQVDPLTRGELPTRAVALDGLLAAPARDGGPPAPPLRHHLLASPPPPPPLDRLVAYELRRQHRHRRVSLARALLLKERCQTLVPNVTSSGQVPHERVHRSVPASEPVS